ncbi:hypothetical protein GOBAR_DD21807 [Gossypium barbadense]|nr:hypothetical protein GOBAR_DD21807 [Gossypium barbadense]
MWCVAISEGSNMVFERPFVLEIRPANAKPELPAVLLVCPPIPSHCKGLTAFSALERLCSMLSLVMCLQSSEILQWSRPWVIYIVFATLSTAVTRKSQHRRSRHCKRTEWDQQGSGKRQRRRGGRCIGERSNSE